MVCPLKRQDTSREYGLPSREADTSLEYGLPVPETDTSWEYGLPSREADTSQEYRNPVGSADREGPRHYLPANAEKVLPQEDAVKNKAIGLGLTIRGFT